MHLSHHLLLVLDNPLHVWQEGHQAFEVLVAVPDFVAVAKAYGIESFRVTKPDEVRPTLEKALAIPGPVVIDCHVEKEENVFPMIPAGGTVNDTIDEIE